MFEELRAIVAENLGVEESELTMETSFREDSGSGFTGSVRDGDGGRRKIRRGDSF